MNNPEYTKDYYRNHKEERNEKRKQYYQNNKEKERKLSDEWKKNNFIKNQDYSSDIVYYIYLFLFYF